MFSSANKTTKTSPAVQQTAGTTFFRKAGEESFFGVKENLSFFKPAVQAKLTVSTPDDPQEKEADAVAEKVMRMPEPVTAAPLPEKNEDKLQRKEEEIQAKEESPLVEKIQCKNDPGLKLQAKLQTCNCGVKENTHIHTKPHIANRTTDDGDHIFLYPSDVMRQRGRGPPTTSIPFEQTLASSKGGGSALPGDTQQFMESRFNADFSGVRVHTDSTAASLSRSVNAQAFAHGNDIYFNSGKFSPDSTEGKTLLAHELTHTVQQGTGGNLSSNKLKRNSDTRSSIYPGKDDTTSSQLNRSHQSKILRVALNHIGEATVYKKESDPRKDSDSNQKQTSATVSAGKSNKVNNIESNILSSVSQEASVRERSDSKRDNKQKGAIPAVSKPPHGETKGSNSKTASASKNLKEKSKGPKKDLGDEPKKKGSKKSGKKNKKSLSPPQVKKGAIAGKTPKPPVEVFPSLVELFGPVPPKKKEENSTQGRHQRATPKIMRQELNTPSRYHTDVTPADHPVIDTGTLSTQINAASNQQQQSVAQQAETTKLQLTASAASFRQSIASNIESTSASVRNSFEMERQSVSTSIDGAIAQMAISLEARNAEASQSGETTKGGLTALFTRNQAETQLLVEQKSQEVVDVKNEETEHAVNVTNQQAASARNSGQQKAGTYPGDERGRVQSKAVIGVANVTAQEIESKQLEIVEAITESMEDIPAAFQEQGQTYLDGLTDNASELNNIINEQVQSTVSLLTEQTGKGNSEIENMRPQLMENLNVTEHSVIEQIQSNVPQFESEVSEALNSANQEMDSAQLEVIQHLQKMQEESILALSQAENEEAAQTFATEVVSALTAIGSEAGSGFQQAGVSLSASFGAVEQSMVSSLNDAEVKVDQSLQRFQESSSLQMSEFTNEMDRGLEQQIQAQLSAFTEIEATAATTLTEGRDDLSNNFNSRVAEVRQQINATVTDGLSNNDEALSQLDSKMSEAASDAAWDYDHPILSAIGDVASFIAGAIVGLIIILAVVLVVIVAFKLLVAGLVLLKISAAVASAIVIIAGIGLLAYGVYTNYQERVQRGEAGGWGTFGLALLDATGLTGMYNAFTQEGLSPFERGLMFGEGLGTFIMTILLVRGAWKGIRGGGLARAWRNLRSPRRSPPGNAPPVEAPPVEAPPEVVSPEVAPVRPAQPVSKPAARHSARSVRQGTVAKTVNTIIASDVPVAEDVAAINRGQATVGRTAGGETTYTINGRTYGSHANGTLYPIEGNGFLTLDRGGFKALGVYNEFGEVPGAEAILDRMGISQAQRASARSAHQLGQR